MNENLVNICLFMYLFIYRNNLEPHEIDSRATCSSRASLLWPLLGLGCGLFSNVVQATGTYSNNRYYVSKKAKKGFTRFSDRIFKLKWLKSVKMFGSS